jgi:hypothetical protein
LKQIPISQQAIHRTARHLTYPQFKPISERNIKREDIRLAKAITRHRSKHDIWSKYRDSTTKAKNLQTQQNTGIQHRKSFV